MIVGHPSGGPDKEIRDLQKIAQGVRSVFLAYAAVRCAVGREAANSGTQPSKLCVE